MFKRFWENYVAMFVPLIALVVVVGLVIYYLVTNAKKKDKGNPPG